MSYYRYWGKAKSEDEGVPYHLLPYHSLDVAAVGWHLLSPERALTQRMAVQLQMAPSALQRFFVFLLGLHDLGKFSRTFQGLAQSQGSGLVPALPRFVYSERHDRLGALLWQERWMDWLKDGTLRWPGGMPERQRRRRLTETLPVLLSPMFGHHGQPVAGTSLELSRFFGSDDCADDVVVAQEFVADWARLVDVEWPVEKLFSAEWLQAFQSLSWTITGWVTLSDWLGSNQAYFRYCVSEMPLVDYWRDYAQPRAQQVLRDTGFEQVLKPLPYAGLSSWFDGQSVTPTPLQHEAETLRLSPGPQLFILEDITGAGKTEAACILTQRLLAAGHGEGLYFALPTMATSNAMYSRLGALHRRFYRAGSCPSFVLAHGASKLNEEFALAIDQPQPGDRNYEESEATATAQCNRWLADSRKKALLADVGVGTIDQVLMGLLPFRHQSLRLYGLARKVLIIDEVHAYDHYMQTLLGKLLSYHAQQGGSAILLTATLPQAMRNDLCMAWRIGLGLDPQPLMMHDFPLLTQVSEAPLCEVALTARAEVSRAVGVDWLTEEDQAIEAIMSAVEAGKCVAWVRNTVNDAIRAFEAVSERHPAPERCLLFHSRFAMCDRQRIESDVIARLGKASTDNVRRGQVLISTQVFQESLDCDVDLMISDLAPIDLLIQRAGRLQRHVRGVRCPPVLKILAPEWSETPDEHWLKRTLEGTHFVYRDASLLWLTQRVLREQGEIRMPEKARTLIESVYGDVAGHVPDGLQGARWEQRGMQNVAGSMANFNALALEDGYVGNRHQWQEEQEIGTRLVDEPTLNVALLICNSDGTLRLLAGSERHTDMLSQIKLRLSQADRLASLPPRYTTQWEALQDRYKALRFVQPWLAEMDAENVYGPSRGLEFGSTSATYSKHLVGGDV